MSTAEQKYVDANPTKDFFIYMITRDIDTKAAIVELIDNAIDGAKRVRKDGNYGGLNISLDFNKDYILIRDNCGGFDVDTAIKYAFKFGRPSNRETEKGFFTGLFGIGMKRALFKLGSKFSVVSTTKTTHFKVEVDVDEWVKEDDWRFPIQDVEESGTFNEDQVGTEIKIEKLHSEQSINFSNPVFENGLLSYIEKYRSVEAENGLEITVNKKTVTFFKEKLIESDNVKCYRNYIHDDDGNIKIIAGIAHSGEPENAGWYVFCNGRLVLFADKTNITGWGTEYRAYHPSLASFRGYVYFESKDLLKLPWNTTKTSVDITNRLYLMAMEKMREAVEQIGKKTTELKKIYDVNKLDDIEDIKNAGELLLNHDTIRNLRKNTDFDIVKIEPKEKMTGISFQVPEEKYNIVKCYMKVTTKKQVGENLFKYYVEMEGI
jgi:hypothetical protein